MVTIDGKSTTKGYFADLRARLKQEGIYENQLAFSAGMPPTQLSRSMRGEMDPRLPMIARLEGAFDRLVAAKKGK